MPAPTKQARRPMPRPAAARRQRSRYRLARWVGVLVVVGLLVVIAVVAVRSSSGDSAAPAPASGPVVAPGHLTPSGSISLGTGQVTVAVYFDYLCPACGAFEAANEDELERLLDAGVITLELRPIAFLDRLSEGTRYSTRAANALATVVDGAPEQVWAFHAALYASQPAEGTEGLTDEQIATIATEAGVPPAVTARFEDARFEAWTAERTERAFADGVQGTPTILVDDQLFEGDPYTAGSLTTAIEAAGR